MRRDRVRGESSVGDAGRLGAVSVTTPPAAEASGGFDVLPTFGHSVGLTPHGGASSALVMSVALGAAGGATCSCRSGAAASEVPDDGPSNGLDTYFELPKYTPRRCADPGSACDGITGGYSHLHKENRKLLTGNKN